MSSLVGGSVLGEVGLFSYCRLVVARLVSRLDGQLVDWSVSY